MIRFHRATPQNSLSPYWTIFELPSEQISEILCGLSCEHHLISESISDVPLIPGLTPAGFQRWMTLLILANPDTEFLRLYSVVRNYPISNAENRRERFPKELSRRLLPRYADSHTTEMLEKLVLTKLSRGTKTYE
jgi:hypothetical protein